MKKSAKQKPGTFIVRKSLSAGGLLSDTGLALPSTMFFMVLLLSLLGTYTTLSRFEIKSSSNSRKSNLGFYSAEAGLNIRTNLFRQIFEDQNEPSGTSPTEPGACVGGNQGSGDFSCIAYSFNNRTVTTYVVESGTNPSLTTVNSGSPYANMSVLESLYEVKAIAEDQNSHVEAILGMGFKVRSLPIFQFAAFYNKDLEVNPGNSFAMNGRIHTNGDLYLDTAVSIYLPGQITASGAIFHGLKYADTCNGGPVVGNDPVNPVAFPACSSSNRQEETDLSAFNGNILNNVIGLTAPDVEMLDAVPTASYYNSADLRIQLKLAAGNVLDTSNWSTGIEVRNADGSFNLTRTEQINSTINCPGGVLNNGGAVDYLLVGDPRGGSYVNYHNHREAAKAFYLLEIDVQAVLNCIHNRSFFALNDTTDGGIILHLTVDGPDSEVLGNAYAVRLRNTGELAATAGGAPAINGLTIVSDQAIVTLGNFNSVNKKPAAIMADYMTVLSGSWSDANSAPGKFWYDRIATTTTINAGILVGTDTSGAIEGVGGQDLGNPSGGLENSFIYQETWTYPPASYYQNLNFTGSIGSLGNRRRGNGGYVGQESITFTPPVRSWNHDTDFNTYANHPPKTPKVTYIRQDLFSRDYEQD